MSDRQIVRMCLSLRFKDLSGTALSAVASFAELDIPVAAVHRVQIVIGGASDAGGEGRIRVTVAAGVHPLGTETVHQAQQFFHLSVGRHAADVRELHRDGGLFRRFQHFGGSRRRPLGTGADMGGDQLPSGTAAAGRGRKLFPAHARDILQTEGDAGAARVQRHHDRMTDGFDLRGGCGAVAVRLRKPLPEPGIPGQHRDIYEAAVPLDLIQERGRIAEVVAAVSGEAGGHAHAQQAGEIRPVRVLIAFPVHQRVLMGVQVDESGADDEAAGIRREIRRGRLRGEAEDLSVFQKDIQPRVDALRRVDDPSVSDQVFHTVPLLLLPSAMVLIMLSGALRPPWPAAALRPGRFRGILPAEYPRERKDRCT